MKVMCSHSEMVDIDLLVPNPKNPNQHPDSQIKLLAKIMKHQGWRSPIVVSNRSGFITKGHGRLMAAKLNGWEQAPVDRQDYETEADEYADMVADNKIAELSETNLSMVNVDVMEFGPDFDLDLLGIPGFEVEPLDRLDPQCDEDDVPEHVEPKTKLGDIYQLGKHRLMCGDSTDTVALDALMGKELADLWLTDPPYGVSYKSNGAEDKHEKIANDDLPIEEMRDFWSAVASNALIHCSDKAAYYWFACQGGDQMMMMMALGASGWKVRHELIWAKDSMVMGRCDYHYKHEPIFYGWKKDGTHEWYSDRKQTSLLEFARPKKSEEHPTMKPVALVEYLMGNSTKSGQIVLDTFGGSGTTLIAAEASGRRARLIEISPKYCDVIVARWEKFTGKKAELING